MAKSIKSFNKLCAEHDVELVKGDGYFYWEGKAFDMWPSECVAHFSHMSWDRWVGVLEHNLTELPLDAN